MERNILRLAPLPPRINAVTVVDDNGDFNIYVNENLSLEEHRRAYDHEIIHIRPCDSGQERDKILVTKRLCDTNCLCPAIRGSGDFRFSALYHAPCPVLYLRGTEHTVLQIGTNPGNFVGAPPLSVL